MRTIEEQDMELEISLLIDLVVAHELVRLCPYPHESPQYKERIRRRAGARGLLSPLKRQRIIVGLERHRQR